MRVIPWSVELLLGTPGRWSLAHTHTFNHTHPSCQAQVHTSASHRRPHPGPLPNGPLLASTTSWTAAAGTGNTNHGNRYSEHRFKRLVHQSTSPENLSTHEAFYTTGLGSLLAALRQCDTLKLYLGLLDLTRGASLENQPFCHAVQTIPPTTFSEILRNFDPFHISSHVDSAPGIAISWGAALYTPLGDLINKWGVKVLYVRILNRLRLIQHARQLPHTDGSPSPIRPLLHDYLVLLRCAGATSDIRVAKAIWGEVFADGYGSWRHADLFAEFVKARYLAEALYANNDLSRFRLRPLDSHRSATHLDRQAVTKLRRLNASLTDSHSHRFGHNVNEYYFAEPLTRLLRKRGPLQRLERRTIIRRMIPGDESLLCAILKANGRNGRGHASNVMMRFWGINISTFKSELGNREISGGHDFPPGAALAPTEALLDAVVHCYGNMGEVLLAKALVDFISSRWDIAVPDKVWSDLLDFARIWSTDPAHRELRIAHFPKKLITPDLVLDIWEFCTQAPHKFQPGIRDYFTLVKSMIGRKRPMDQFLEAIRQLTPLYNQAAQQVQVAWAELILTTQQGVPNHAAYRRYRVLQSRKHYMWYCFHYAARQALKDLNPLHVDNADAVRHVPNLVAELQPFLRATIRYRIATGIVDLRLAHQSLRTQEAEQAVHQPEDLCDRPMPKKRSTGGTRGEKSAVIDWAALESLPNGTATTAALRDYLEMMDVKQQAEQDKPIDEDEPGDPDDIDDWDEKDERVLIQARRPRQRVQDAFDESRNPAYEPRAAEHFEKTPKRESALREDAFADAFTHHHRDTVNNSRISQYSDDWDEDATPNNVAFRSRQSKSQQLVERPAYMFRPRYSASPGQPSLSAMREDGREFTGFHDDPRKAHFAAHRIIRGLTHAPGVPVNLGAPGVPIEKGHLMEDLLHMRI